MAKGRPLRFLLTGGNVADGKGKAADALLAHKAYDSDAIRRFIKDQDGLEHSPKAKCTGNRQLIPVFAPSAHGLACETVHSAYRCME
jgi:hypothetical protein